MTSVPVFPGKKNKKQQPSVSLYTLASLEGHTCPRVLLGAGQTSVLTPSSPQLRFWGVLMLSQHGRAGKGPRKPQMSHSLCARRATSHGCVGTGSRWGPHPGASAPQEAQSSWSIDPTAELGPPCKPKLKGLGSMGAWEAEGAGVVSCTRRRQMRGFSLRKGVMEGPPQLRAELAVSAPWGNEGKDARTISWPERALKNGVKGR